MTLDDGRVVTYELSGPLVPGFREYRILMLDLGRDLSTRLELLHGTKVIAEEKQPRDVIRSMRCLEEYPLDMPRNPEEVAKSPLAQCMEKAGSELVTSVLGEVLTAIVTPFDKDGAVDYDRFRVLARHVIDSGADGLLVAATTGESPTLTDEEKLLALDGGRGRGGERATVIASTGTYSTAHSVNLTEQAHALGVDGFLVVTPYYNKPPPRGIVEHFKAIAAASDKPIIVYNIPQRVVVNIEPETMLELAADPDRAGRQAGDRGARPGAPHRRRDRARRSTRAATTSSTRSSRSAGWAASSSTETSSRVRVKEMIRFYKEGDVETARMIDEELKPLVDVLGVTINPIPVKAALRLLGHEVGGLRLPLVEATEDEIAEIRSVLERVGLTAPVRV